MNSKSRVRETGVASDRFLIPTGVGGRLGGNNRRNGCGKQQRGPTQTKTGDRMQLDEAEFNAFWRLYPRKKSKGDAFKAWQQTKARRPELQKVLQAVVVLKESDDWLREDGRFIPYPATWLRQWGWADVSDDDKADVRGDSMWWKTTSGIEAKAKELGMEWDALNGETFQQFAERVKGKARDMKVVPMAASA